MLILTGERDPLVRLYNAHILRRTIRRAELHVLQGPDARGYRFIRAASNALISRQSDPSQ